MTELLTSLEPRYDICERKSSGVIHMMVRGFFEPVILNQHFDSNREVVERWRKKGQRIRVLIDATSLLPHTPECQQIVQSATRSIYQADDKVAVLVSSSLVKMQMRRALKQGETIEFFVSERAASLWLCPSLVTAARGEVGPSDGRRTSENAY